MGDISNNKGSKNTQILGIDRLYWPFTEGAIFPSFCSGDRSSEDYRHFFVSIVILFRCTETFANEICFPKTPKEVPEFYLHI